LVKFKLISFAIVSKLFWRHFQKEFLILVVPMSVPGFFINTTLCQLAISSKLSLSRELFILVAPVLVPGHFNNQSVSCHFISYHFNKLAILPDILRCKTKCETPQGNWAQLFSLAKHASLDCQFGQMLSWREDLTPLHQQRAAVTQSGKDKPVADSIF